MRRWWQDLADLVLPAECGGCGRPRSVLCGRCGAVLSGAAPCRVRPVPEPSGLPEVYAAARYEDEVRAVLLAHKERGVLALAAPLGAALAGAVRAGLGEQRARGAPVLLVPVPSSRRVVRARGHDPARRIALAAAGGLRRSGTPARVVAVLRQRRSVADQSGLGSQQRLANLAGALAVVPGGARLLREGGPVVLVDDLMTTGASLLEAARAVRTAAPGAERGAGPGTYPTVRSPVYPGAVWEGREEQGNGAAEVRTGRASAEPEMAGGTGDRPFRGLIRAAVVAASPSSFELNRN
ncbi:ComF family protein [Streptomyces ziwulingensis]